MSCVHHHWKRSRPHLKAGHSFNRNALNNCSWLHNFESKGLTGPVWSNYLTNGAFLLADFCWVCASLVIDAVSLATIRLKGVHLPRFMWTKWNKLRGLSKFLELCYVYESLFSLHWYCSCDQERLLWHCDTGNSRCIKNFHLYCILLFFIGDPSMVSAVFLCPKHHTSIFFGYPNLMLTCYSRKGLQRICNELRRDYF